MTHGGASCLCSTALRGLISPSDASFRHLVGLTFLFLHKISFVLIERQSSCLYVKKMKLFSGCLTFFWPQRGLRIVVKLWHLVSLILFLFFVFEIGFGDLLVFRRRLFGTFGTTQACSRLLSQNKKACRLYWAHFSWAYLSVTRPIMYCILVLTFKYSTHQLFFLEKKAEIILQPKRWQNLECSAYMTTSLQSTWVRSFPSSTSLDSQRVTVNPSRCHNAGCSTEVSWRVEFNATATSAYIAPYR